MVALSIPVFITSAKMEVRSAFFIPYLCREDPFLPPATSPASIGASMPRRMTPDFSNGTCTILILFVAHDDSESHKACICHPWIVVLSAFSARLSFRERSKGEHFSTPFFLCRGAFSNPLRRMSKGDTTPLDILPHDFLEMKRGFGAVSLIASHDWTRVKREDPSDKHVVRERMPHPFSLI